MGIVTNDAAINASGISSRLALLHAQCRITRIFSPEHGITVQGADGLQQQDDRDILTGLPVTSLYSKRLAPSEEALRDIDLVLFDIPDVGARFYTYLWTMTYVMESCAQFNKPLIVLDRPNPIGALLEHAEGPMLDEQHCASFIGRYNIPLKHACTLGELALYFAATRFPGLDIQVEKVDNYRRHHKAGRDFPFIPTSPAIQQLQAAMLYPGTGLLEGVLVNEGRGTDHPFEQFGAPWIDGKALCDALQLTLAHVQVSPIQYRPISGVYADALCQGVSLRITDPQAFMAVSAGITILQTLARIYPEHVQERLYQTHANPSGAKHLDKLLGCPSSFERVCQQESFELDIAQRWHDEIKPFLLYAS
jgi:uncharacterized protein YbbC (DUF1343 family)